MTLDVMEVHFSAEMQSVMSDLQGADFWGIGGKVGGSDWFGPG